MDGLKLIYFDVDTSYMVLHIIYILLEKKRHGPMHYYTNKMIHRHVRVVANIPILYHYYCTQTVLCYCHRITTLVEGNSRGVYVAQSSPYVFWFNY